MDECQWNHDFNNALAYQILGSKNYKSKKYIECIFYSYKSLDILIEDCNYKRAIQVNQMIISSLLNIGNYEETLALTTKQIKAIKSLSILDSYYKNAINCYYISLLGLKKYEDELHDLKVYKRKEVAQKIKEAREQGDLSENAEYDAAKDEQRDIEARIEELEKILKNAEVVDEDEVDLERINIGCQVKIYDFDFDEELDYKIVGSTEANSLKGKISNESPVGKALLGAKVGDIVEVETQAGVIKYKVLEIQRSN